MKPNKVRPKAAPAPAAPPSPFIRGGGSIISEIVPQSKRQHHFDDLAVNLAAKYGWEGAPTDQIHGLQVSDARNFLRKTLHEIHIAAVAGSGCPDLVRVAAHFEHVDPTGTKTLRSIDDEDTAELLATLHKVYDDEVAELKTIDPKVLEAKLKSNAEEDAETRKRGITQMALDGAGL